MTDHVVVEHRDSGTNNGVMVGIIAVALIAIVGLFFVFGGPARFAGGQAQTPNNTTNVNVPAQSQQPPSGPNITIPKQIDVNINQPGQQAPAAGAPASGGR
jgi:hypothetical protein